MSIRLRSLALGLVGATALAAPAFAVDLDVTCRCVIGGVNSATAEWLEQSVIPAFEAANPDIKVKLNQFGGEDAQLTQQLALDFSTGAGPDIAGFDGFLIPSFAEGGLLKDLSVRETVAYVASLFAAAQSVDEVLRQAGISGLADRKVGKCSGGEQQRLRFALALLPDPALLLLDEPTTGMDVEGRRTFWNAIREDTRRGRTILFATHYLEEADQYADRIVLVSEGLVVADGSGAEVKALASGRTVRATLPGARAEELTALPGVDSVELRGDAVLIHAKDTDEVARHLLTRTAARDLEITTRGLEEAFLSLTAPAGSAAAGSEGADQ